MTARFVRGALCSVVLLGTALIPSTSLAKAVRAQAEGRARRLLDSGIASLSTRNLAQASRDIEASYRAQPSAEALFYLGALALADGRPLDAQDFMRRYLLDPRLSATSDNPESQEAQRVLSLNPLPSGQLGMQGADGTVVSVDGRLRGVLPLSRPLLLSPGRHEITLEQGNKKQQESIEIAASRYYELRHSMASGAVVIAELPSVLLLDSASGDAEAGTLTFERFSAELRSENHTLLPRVDARLPIDGKDPASCLEDRACQIKQGLRAGADVVFRTRLVKQDADILLQVEAIDPKVGEVAASADKRCTGCSTKDAVHELTKLAIPLLRAAQSRPRGILEVSSVPSGASVKLGARSLGTTPVSQPLFAGPIELTASLGGFEELVQKTEVIAQQTTKLTLQLHPLLLLAQAAKPMPPQVPRSEAQRRLFLRRVIGGGVSAVGVLMLGFGISGLYMSTQCAAPVPVPGAVCPEGYHTIAPGAALTATGGAVLLTGIGLMVIPAPPWGK